MDPHLHQTRFASSSSNGYNEYPHFSLRQQTSQQSTLTTIFTILLILYLTLLYFSIPLPSPLTLTLKTLTHLLPSRLLLTKPQRLELRDLKARGMYAHAHAVKKEALRGLLGFGGVKVLQALPAGTGEVVGAARRVSMSALRKVGMQGGSGGGGDGVVGAPPGLGNWDNSCYQNCVLQGLAGLESLRPYLRSLVRVGEDGEEAEGGETTIETLLTLVERLNDEKNNGQLLWTPAKLKKMSSWQQQDAQEYLSKILEEVEKEATKAFKSVSHTTSPTGSTNAVGLASLLPNTSASQQRSTLTDPASEAQSTPDISKSPLDGLLAQSVTCTTCHHSEGLSLIPFNCLTLPLPLASAAYTTDLTECLDEYTKLEEISQVECAKCTLLTARRKLESILPGPPSYVNVDEMEEVDKVMKLPPELRAQSFQRLAKIQQALEGADFADKTIGEICAIPKNARVSSTKTRQAVIARPSRCLVMHVNRSVFDENTGILRKNYARVSYPRMLNLDDWMLSQTDQHERSEVDGLQESVKYVLKAVVTHYGRHENGHYICFRRHGVKPGFEEGDDVGAGEKCDEAGKDAGWWRLSDEDVSPVEEDDVLGQGGVFMLFYERVEEGGRPPRMMSAGDLAVSAPGEVEPVAIEDATTPGPGDEASVAADHHPPNALLEDPPATPASTTVELNPFSEPASPLGQPSTEATTEDEADVEELPRSSYNPPSPVRMRTARIPDLEAKREFERPGEGFRYVAAS